MMNGTRGPVARRRARAGFLALGIVAWLACALVGHRAGAQTTVDVSVGQTRAVVPTTGLGIHTSVYDNSLQYTGSPVFDQLNGRLDDAGVSTLRYPGGGYADVFHWSVQHASPNWPVSTNLAVYDLTKPHPLTPWWGQSPAYPAEGEPWPLGYLGPKTDFGNFVKLLDATGSQAVITVNYGSSLGKLVNVQGQQQWRSTLGGQPQEAAAWVAYANGDAALYNTPADVPLGVDAEGNDFKTVGYWAQLRASTPAQNPDNQYDFLAIGRAAPVGIKYWEIGNETFGNGYYGGGNGYSEDLSVPYDGTPRNGHPDLSPAHYGTQVNAFAAAMKLADPTIHIGAVLNTPPDDTWGPTWNQEVLALSGEAIDFAVVHWYPDGGSGSASNTSSLLSRPRTKIPLMISNPNPAPNQLLGLRQALDAARADDGSGVEIFVTEVGPHSSVTATTQERSLFAADSYVTFLENGVANVDWLELHNGSFLAEATNEPGYAYYGVQLAHRLAAAGDELVAISSSSNSIRAHAAVRSDGSVAVMLINTGSGSSTIGVSIDGDPLYSSGTLVRTNADAGGNPLPLSEAAVGGLGNAFTASVPGKTIFTYLLSSVLLGDLNLDRAVDIFDVNVVSAHWDESGPEGDVNGDGIVDIFDVNLISDQWTGGAAAAVPEPAALALAACAAAAAVRVAQRYRRGCDQKPSAACLRADGHPFFDSP